MHCSQLTKSMGWTKKKKKKKREKNAAQNVDVGISAIQTVTSSKNHETYEVMGENHIQSKPIPSPASLMGKNVIDCMILFLLLK